MEGKAASELQKAQQYLLAATKTLGQLQKQKQQEATYGASSGSADQRAVAASIQTLRTLQAGIEEVKAGLAGPPAPGSLSMARPGSAARSPSGLPLVLHELSPRPSSVARGLIRPTTAGLPARGERCAAAA